ncbi:endonuclease/exonuclease/phosphatase family protein [Glutamicibacter uratoxydans]|uniref:endonuclease/exonuclease/phosphatase family protein n=1 Tax=Glutamicibacter uratoxydans TaxID=43667 RepID=UPI003D6E7231
MARMLIILGCLMLTLILVFHQQIPDVLGLGLFVDNLAPWLGLAIPLLLVFAIVAGGRGTYLTLLLPTLAWALIFGPQVLPAPKLAPQQGLTVATQNIGGKQDLETARTLADSGAEIISLQEVQPGRDEYITQALADSHPHFYSVGTVGVWSALPLDNAQSLDLGLDWSRALRLDVQTSTGTVRFYTVHAASARPTGHADRDMMLANLAEYIAQDPSPRIIAAGDFNATATDRHFRPISAQLNAMTSSSWGPTFTWPRTPFAMLGIDHVLTRGLAHASLERVEAGASDHYALLAEIELAETAD